MDISPNRRGTRLYPRCMSAPDGSVMQHIGHEHVQRAIFHDINVCRADADHSDLLARNHVTVSFSVKTLWSGRSWSDPGRYCSFCWQKCILRILDRISDLFSVQSDHLIYTEINIEIHRSPRRTRYQPKCIPKTIKCALWSSTSWSWHPRATPSITTSLHMLLDSRLVTISVIQYNPILYERPFWIFTYFHKHQPPKPDST